MGVFTDGTAMIVNHDGRSSQYNADDGMKNKKREKEKRWK